MKDLLYTFLVFSLGLSVFSCNDDYLNKYPQTSIAPEEFFKSEEDLKLYIDGLLSLPDKYIYDQEQGTDNLATTGAVELKTILTGTPTAENLLDRWSWNRLRDINYFLENVDKANVDVNVRNHYIGLARMYRAQFYYDKIRRYSDVPWYSGTLSTSDEESLYKTRDSRAMVVDSLMADLEFAYNNVWDEVPSGTPGKWSVATVYARIALEEGSWRRYHPELELQNSADQFFQLAKEISGDIMNSGLFAIHNTGNPESDYKDLFSSQDLQGNPEVILPHIYDTELGHGQDLTHIFTDYEQSPTRELLQTYLMIDGSRFTDIEGYEEMTFVEEFQNRDYRLMSSYAYPGWVNRGDTEPYIQRLNKNFTGYHQIKGYQTSIVETENQSVDMPVYRYAEVLLIFAEASAELNEIDQSVIDQTINPIRERAGVASLDLAWANANPDPFLEERYPNVESENLGALLEIRRERRVELAFEDFRFNDLMRWAASNLLMEAPKGMYFPGLGQYDLTGDGVVDIELISKDRDIPFEEEKEENSKGEKLIYYRVSTIDDGTGTVYLENGENGGPIITENVPRDFVDPKYYYRPIPQKQMVLNPNLEQIFGW